MALIHFFTPFDAMDGAAMVAGAYVAWWLTQGSSTLVQYGAAAAGWAAGGLAGRTFRLTGVDQS